MLKLEYKDFKAARRAFPAPAFALQGFRAGTYQGQSYAAPHDGEGAAAYAMRKARDAMAAEAAAKAAREEARAALRSLWEEGGGKREGIPGLKAARAAVTAAEDKARRAAAWRYPRDAGDNGPAGFLRYVGRVVPEAGRQWEDRRGDCGWNCDPFGHVFRDGSGLCFGVVYQLTGKDGAARFVAGFEFGGVDGGPCLDLSRVYSVTGEEDAESGAYHSGAVRAADNAAKAAAEEEREYQSAWQAGRQWAELKEEAAEARAAALALLAERRAAKARAGDNLPAICRAIRDSVAGHVRTIREARERMAKLAAGDAESLWFYPGEDRLAAAFCEGAELDAMPGAGA